jgi:hypothetical protein
MSDNTHLSDVANTEASTVIQHDWSTHAPPEMTPESIEVLRAVIAEHEMVEVEWHDPRTVSRAPWDLYCYQREDMWRGVCLSIGFADDLPDEMAILVRPHIPHIVFGDDEDWNEGEIVIPYRSIRFIHPLVAGKAKFSCYTSGRPRRTRRAAGGDHTR